jgi:hemoglobin
MREGHKHLVRRGLGDQHVDAVVELLGQSLAEHGVAAADIQEIAAIANSVRGDVLDRPKT